MDVSKLVDAQNPRPSSTSTLSTVDPTTLAMEDTHRFRLSNGERLQKPRLLEGLDTNSPLPPSVEKAYYRKCIELKRRLNEVEAANDEARVRRVRLDRGILKMRLERAFLLDELRKRMEHNVDASEGSADEGMATPPADRPHRDKRRRPLPPAQAAPTPGGNSHSHHPAPSAPTGRAPSHSEPTSYTPSSYPATAQSPADYTTSRSYGPYGPYQSQSQTHQTPPVGNPASPYDRPPSDRQTNGGAYDRPSESERDTAPTSRHAGATGEYLTAGPSVHETPNAADLTHHRPRHSPNQRVTYEYLPGGGVRHVSSPRGGHAARIYQQFRARYLELKHGGTVSGYKQALHVLRCRRMDPRPCTCGLRGRSEDDVA